MSSPVNKPCPCGSGKKYKKCCLVFHNGAKPKNALELMKSRYSAFAVDDAKYILKTTHKENTDFSQDKQTWEKSVLDFSKNTSFDKLTIIDFVDGEDEAYVEFLANLIQNQKDISFIERSKFKKEDNMWKYHSGEIKNG
eukprot:Anaeramoba_flamelloidesa569597_87.p2 GENE.a569597_87~~a569597_87.p2  ORF type:complete len:139 (-),score=10.60 a569597_87:248-664(-)